MVRFALPLLRLVREDVHEIMQYARQIDSYNEIGPPSWCGCWPAWPWPICDRAATNQKPANQKTSEEKIVNTSATGAAGKVTHEHLRRDAYLYVRQSTLKQVLSNTESATRQ